MVTFKRSLTTVRDGMQNYPKRAKAKCDRQLTQTSIIEFRKAIILVFFGANLQRSSNRIKRVLSSGSHDFEQRSVVRIGVVCDVTTTSEAASAPSCQCCKAEQKRYHGIRVSPFPQLAFAWKTHWQIEQQPIPETARSYQLLELTQMKQTSNILVETVNPAGSSETQM